MMTKNGHILHGERQGEGINMQYGDPSLKQPIVDKNIVDFFLNRTTEKPTYEIEYISHPKYKGKTKEDSLIIKAEIEEILKKYPHKKKIGILCAPKYYGNIHHYISYDYDSAALIEANQYVVAEYENGELTFNRELFNKAKYKQLEEQREEAREYDAAVDKVRNILNKKYDSEQVNGCFHSNFKGAKLDLVYDFVKEMKPITDRVLKIWKSSPSTKTIINYGRNIECHVLQNGPVKHVLVVRGGKVIDQITGL